jgi:hypothetical protein
MMLETAIDEQLRFRIEEGIMSRAPANDAVAECHFILTLRLIFLLGADKLQVFTDRAHVTAGRRIFG